MVDKIREEGEKWVIKQAGGIFIYLFLSPPQRGSHLITIEPTETFEVPTFLGAIFAIA